MNRRKWLKATSLLTGGIAFLPAGFNGLTAAPVQHRIAKRALSDYEMGLNDLPAPQGPACLPTKTLSALPKKLKRPLSNSLNSSYQYPMMEGMELAKKIAQFEGVDEKMLMLSAGSSPMLETAAMYFSKDGGNIVTGDPTYEDLPERAEMLKAQWIKVPLTTEYKLDLDAMEKAVNTQTKMVYICNPNNPTGTSVDAARLRGVL